MSRFLLPTGLVLAVLMATPWQVHAQPGGGRGGSSAGRGSSSGVRPSIGYAPSIGAAYRGTAARGYNAYYHNGNYYRHYPYLFPYYYPFAFGYYDYSYAPNAFGYPVPGSYLYDTTPPPGSAIDGPPDPALVRPFGTGTDREAVIEVFVPTENAQVWLEGTKTDSTGTRRSFMTPPLAPGSYTYHVTAVWTQDGHEVRAERTLSIVAGHTVVADFRKSSSPPRMPPAD